MRPTFAAESSAERQAAINVVVINNDGLTV